MFMFAWGFGSFCFYKIASALAFDEPPNVLSCLVLAVVTTGVMFMLTKALVVRYGKWCGDRLFKGRGQNELVQELVAITLFSGGVAALAGWLVVIGFDASFSDGLIYEDYPSGYEIGDLIVAMAIFAFPTLANGAMGALALYVASGQLPIVEKQHSPKATQASPLKVAPENPPKATTQKRSSWLIEIMVVAVLALFVALLVMEHVR